MTLDTPYDAGPEAPVPAGEDGAGCHSGAEKLRAQAMAAGSAELLEGFARDYPQGPHDKPQSMCPAFGSLRVGLRMRRVATVLSGSACCVYGLTFVSHFYGARRSVGYVPFNSETLVTGKLFEDIREAVHKLADPAHYDAIIVTNLCVPTASGVPLRLLPKTIDGVRIIGIDVPGFGIPTHAEAKDVLAGAMLAYARAEIEAGPVAAPERRAVGPADGHAARRDVPGGPHDDRRAAGAAGPRGGAGGAVPGLAGALRRARLRRGGGDPSVLHRGDPRVRGGGADGVRVRAGRTRRNCGLAGERRRRLRPWRREGGGGAERAPSRRSSLRSPPPPSTARSRSRATRARSCWSRGC